MGESLNYYKIDLYKCNALFTLFLESPASTQCLAVCSNLSMLRAVRANLDPFLANSTANPAPIPLEAPVKCKRK